jgi:hypothetical protein
MTCRRLLRSHAGHHADLIERVADTTVWLPDFSLLTSFLVNLLILNPTRLSLKFNKEAGEGEGRVLSIGGCGREEQTQAALAAFNVKILDSAKTIGCRLMKDVEIQESDYSNNGRKRTDPLLPCRQIEKPC